MKATPDNVKQIHAYLIEHGLTTDEVRADVLDHICTMLEQQPDELDFTSASTLIEAAFPPSIVRQIQIDTLYYLNVNSKITMLKFIFATGYMALCFLVLASFGASNGMMLPDVFYYYGVPALKIAGILIFCFGFLPALFLYTYQRSLERVKQ